MRKNTETATHAFYVGSRNQSSPTIHTDGRVLFSYRTAIAEKAGKEDGAECIYLNVTKYSSTTSRQQSEIRAFLSKFVRIIEVRDVPQGAQSLARYVN